MIKDSQGRPFHIKGLTGYTAERNVVQNIPEKLILLWKTELQMYFSLVIAIVK